MVGATQVGKSTFLNSIVNNLMGVEMCDNFRSAITTDMLDKKDSGSATSDVTIYGIPRQGKMKKAIRLIDAPGFCDTRGIKRDE